MRGGMGASTVKLARQLYYMQENPFQPVDHTHEGNQARTASYCFSSSLFPVSDMTLAHPISARTRS